MGKVETLMRDQQKILEGIYLECLAISTIESPGDDNVRVLACHLATLSASILSVIVLITGIKPETQGQAGISA